MANCSSAIRPRRCRWPSAIFFFSEVMTVVENLHSAAEIGSRYETYRRDTLTLTWEERRQGHGKRRSDAGIEFAISIPAGAILKGGDCMVLEPEQTIVRVQEAP